MGKIDRAAITRCIFQVPDYLRSVFIELKEFDNLNNKAKWCGTTTSFMLLLLQARDFYEIGNVVPPRVLELDCCGGLEECDDRVYDRHGNQKL